jgi:5'-methylthioadenosine phosphorylase
VEKAIIGGTGVYDVGEESYKKNISTEYGDVEVDVLRIEGEEIAFLARHGKGHSVPPHLINYRANMMALKKLGVKYIYATVAVGSCNEKFAPGDIVVIKDFIDFTKSRPMTFYEGGEKGVIHTDMTDPYCKNLRKIFYEVAEKEEIDIKGEGVYVCTEGPRFETVHEIKMYKLLGGDVVGMTNVPEVVLAKELGMCYQAVGIISNWCTGIEGEDVTIHDIKGSMNLSKEKLTKGFIKALLKDLNQDHCSCKDSLIKL